MSLCRSTGSYYMSGFYPPVSGECDVCRRPIDDMPPMAAWQLAPGIAKKVIDVCGWACALRVFQQELKATDRTKPR